MRRTERASRLSIRKLLPALAALVWLGATCADGARPPRPRVAASVSENHADEAAALPASQPPGLDPDEDLEVANLFAFVWDQLEVRYCSLELKTFNLAVGFDSTTRHDKRAERVLEKELNGLVKMFIKCRKIKDCDCTELKDELPHINIFYDDAPDKPAPPDGVYDLFFPGGRDLALVTANIKKVQVKETRTPTYRIVVTRSKITTEQGEARASTLEGGGTLFNLKRASGGFGLSLAHELGHFAGYYRHDNPDDVVHAPWSERFNHMRLFGGDFPDCQWYQKVSKLVK